MVFCLLQEKGGKHPEIQQTAFVVRVRAMRANPEVFSCFCSQAKYLL